MKINNISFTGVTPIIARNKKTIQALDEHLKKTSSTAHYNLQDATNLYKNRPVTGLLGNACNEENKRIAFLITGKDKIYQDYMERDWYDDAAPSRHISEDIIELEKYDSPKRQVQFDSLAMRVNADWWLLRNKNF